MRPVTTVPASPDLPESLSALLRRRSAPALSEPAPTEEQLRLILAAAGSVPDHGRLRPYRFVVVRDDARQRFGVALRDAAIEADADPVTIAKAIRKPMFGPLLVAIILSPKAHPTVPIWEQQVSAGLTGYAMTLAAASLGVGATWKSGHHLDGAPVRRLLGMTGDERLLGWVNLGTPAVPTKHKEDRMRPELRVAELPPDPLMQVAALQERLEDPHVVVCDVRWYLDDPTRGRREYLEGHIPGARFVDLDTDLADHDDADALGRHPLPSPMRFAATLARLGIGRDDLVVAYDDGSGVPASRLWWMLDALGYRGARVLDGGIAAWRAADGPLRGGEEVAPETAAPDAADVPVLTWPRTIDRHVLRERLGEVVLLDARAGARYRGEVEPVDPRPGHIPTARSLPAATHVGSDARLLPVAELAGGFEALGVAGSEVVVSCGSGVTACHTALAMRVAGLPDPVLYPGSYSDWVTAGWPVITGEDPGGPVPPDPALPTVDGPPTPGIPSDH